MKHSYSWIIPSFTITDWSFKEKSAWRARCLLLLGREETAVSGWDHCVRKAKKDFWEHPTFNASFVIHLWCYIPYSWECFIKYQALFKNKFAKLFFCFSFKSKLSFLDNRDSLTSANVLMLIVSKKKHISDKDWAEAAQQIRKHFFKN